MWTIDEAAEELRALLVEATRLRLRADVPVGAYLSSAQLVHWLFVDDFWLRPPISDRDNVKVCRGRESHSGSLSWTYRGSKRTTVRV